MKSTFPVIAIGLGMLLLLGSALWPVLFPTTSTWTDEKSQKLNELGKKAQQVHYALEMAKRKPNMTGGENPAVLQQKYEAAMQELNALRAEFTSADQAPQSLSALLKWTGIAVLGVGLVSWIATRG